MWDSWDSIAIGFKLYGVERSVPEPATVALLGAALLGFALVRRRRALPLTR